MEQESEFPTKAPGGYGFRHTVALMLSFASAVSYAMRFNLSLAIVAMVNSPMSLHRIGQHSNVSGSCSQHINNSYNYNNGLQISNNTNTTEVITLLKFDGEDRVKNISGNYHSNANDTAEFGWSEAEQGLILGVFMWGYLVGQIPGGILAKRFGGKWPIGLGILVSAVFCILTPIFARISKGMLIFARIVQGMATGLHMPGQTTMLALWAPPTERNFLTSVAFNGAAAGVAVMYVTSGYLIGANVMGGWPSVFYITGIASMVWFVFWSFLAYSAPKDHPRISREELTYIATSLQESASYQQMSTPWKNVLTSLPIWAIFIANFTNAWGIYVWLSIPTYMNTVLNFDIEKNSWMSALPPIASIIFGPAFAQISDVCIRQNWLSILTTRKASQFVSQGLAALALIGCGYSGCNPIAAVTLLVLAKGFAGASPSSTVANYVDLTPNHAGIIFSAWNMVGSSSGFVVPFVTGLLINGDPSVENWRIVFFLCSGLYIGGTIFYFIFASAEVQPWNSGSSPSDTSTLTYQDTVSTSTTRL